MTPRPPTRCALSCLRARHHARPAEQGPEDRHDEQPLVDLLLGAHRSGFRRDCCQAAVLSGGTLYILIWRSVRVAQRRCAFHGLLIYREGDRAESFFSYGFYRNKVVLLPQTQEPARGDIHKLKVHVVVYIEVIHATGGADPGVEDSLLAEFVVRGTRVLVVRYTGEVHGDLSSLPLGGEEHLLTALLQRGQEPSDRKDGQFSATLRAEGGTHRPCAHCINHRLPVQRARCSSTFWRGCVPTERGPGVGSSLRPGGYCSTLPGRDEGPIQQRYSPKCREEAFSEVRPGFIGNSSPLSSMVALANWRG